MVKMSTMAAPTYMPASIERTRWLTSERRWSVELGGGLLAQGLTVSVYMEWSIAGYYVGVRKQA